MPTTEHVKITSSRKSAKGAEIALILHVPDNVSTSNGPIPAIIMCSGIGAINHETLHLAPFARTFASAGYAGVTFDYVSWGASGGSPRNVLVIEDELADALDVVAWVRSQPERFDSKRLVIWGSSFGGMHVAAALSGNHDLAAGIAQCPLVDGLKASLQIPVGSALKVGVRGVADVLRSVVGGGKPVYVPLYSNGREVALMEGQEVVDGWKGLCGGGSTDFFEHYPNYIAARIGLALGLHRPVLGLKKSTVPLLVVLPEWDHQASLSAAKKAAVVAPKGESVTVKGGHFDLYENGPGYEENVKAQLAFLQKVFAAV